MERRVVDRWAGCLCIVFGAVALAIPAGCSTNHTGFSDATGTNEAGPRPIDGIAQTVDGSGLRDASRDGPALGRGGAGGSVVNPGTGGTTTLPPIDAALVDVPQATGGTSDGSAGGGAGGIITTGGIVTTGGAVGSGGRTGNGGATGTPRGGAGGTSRDAALDARDAALDLPAERPSDARMDAAACTSASTCPAPTSGNGTAVCQGGLCGITCNDGYHRCGNTCASNTSIESCGTGANSCTPCPDPPANGRATCRGNPLACGFACNTGYHACGNSCVVNGSTDPASCGNSCTVCRAPSNGSVTCNGSSCVLACNSGYHLCGNACLPNNSVDSCGTSCGACPQPAHSTATCSGSPLACGLTCESGYHLCGSSCVANDSPSSCGAACTPCPTDPAGRATCNGTTCGITCNTGYHWCNGHCVSSTSPESCGTSCTPCPTAIGAAATCSGNPLICGLDWNCSPGNHECGGTCVPQSADQCGPSCAPCPGQGAGANSHPTCSSSGVCGNACDSGYHDCGEESLECVSNNSVANCGETSCSPCPDPPPHGRASCDGTKCTVVCDSSDSAKYHLCGSTCVLDTDLNACGTSCSPCPYPPESERDTTYATCDGTRCGFACYDGYHLCGTGSSAACFANDDATHCGSDCKDCEEGERCQEGACSAPESEAF